jgi:hypothetical protein
VVHAPLHLLPVSTWLPGVGAGLRTALRWGSAHTGLPVVLVAAAGLVVSLRLARRWAGFAVEVAVAAGVLAAATRFGWIRW